MDQKNFEKINIIIQNRKELIENQLEHFISNPNYNTSMFLNGFVETNLFVGMAKYRLEKDFSAALGYWQNAVNYFPFFEKRWLAEIEDQKKYSISLKCYGYYQIICLAYISGCSTQAKKLFDFFSDNGLIDFPEDTHLLPWTPRVIMGLFLIGRSDLVPQCLPFVRNYIEKELKNQNTTLFVPFMEGYFAVKEGDEKALNDHLLEGQVRIKKYRGKTYGGELFGAGTPANDMVLDLNGLVLAIYAARFGLKVTIESPYFPQDLYKKLVELDRVNW